MTCALADAVSALEVSSSLDGRRVPSEPSGRLGVTTTPGSAPDRAGKSGGSEASPQAAGVAASDLRSAPAQRTRPAGSDGVPGT